MEWVELDIRRFFCVNESMVAPPTYENTRSSRELAATFGWAQQELRTLEIEQGATRVDLTRGSIAGEPAAVFGTVSARNGFDPVDAAALYGYHSSAQWGVVADDTGLNVFNPHWLVDSNWFRVPHVPWSEVDQNLDLIQALTPQGLIEREPVRAATKRCEPTDFLKPVDDALVERLDRWRDQALRYARSTQGVDELLQTFYAQLFVLRTVEDRELDPAVQAASSAVSGSDGFSHGEWQNILMLAKEHIGSDLFDIDVTPDIPDHVLAGVITDLYKPYKVPGSNSRYNFSWIDADVLGFAYEKYLASILHPASLPAQVDLFLPPERGVERYSVRKTAGAYYTPKYITDFLSARCVEEYFADDPTAEPPAIMDFACGSGSFLVAAVDKVLRHLKTIDSDRAWGRELVEGGYIAGIDVDAKAVTAARLHLWQRLIEEPHALPLPNLSNVVLTGDGLDRETWGDLNRNYDIVLGNPPFLATSLVASREELEARFVTARGRYDFSSLFVEQAVNVLTDGGRLGLVVPNRLFRNKSGAPLRRLLTERAELHNIVDFGSTKPFDADAYVGCIVAQKRPPGSQLPAKVQVIEVRSLEAEFIASLLLAAAATGEAGNSALIRVFEARHPHGDTPWRLLSEEEQRSRIMIEEVSVRLDTIADVPQGIRTGANDLFIFTLESEESGELCRVSNEFAGSLILETDLLEEAVYGSQVRRYEAIRTDTRLLYPYRNNVAVPESELQARYPHAWAYFVENRPLLGARESLKKSNGRFYELVWPRDERWLRQPKLLIRDLAPATAFAADPRGSVFLVGGTAVVPEDPEILLALMAYLNSSVVNVLVQQTTPEFRGGFQKFEPQHIQGIPILDRLSEDPQFLGELTEMAGLIISLDENDPARAEMQQHVDQRITAAVEERGISVPV